MTPLKKAAAVAGSVAVVAALLTVQIIPPFHKPFGLGPDRPQSHTRAISGPTVTIPGPRVTVTVPAPTETTTAPGSTSTVTTPGGVRTLKGSSPTVTVPGPTSTDTVTVPGVTRTVHVPSPVQTRLIYRPVPGPTQFIRIPGPTKTVKVKVPVPGPTVTVKVPLPRVTVTLPVIGGGVSTSRSETRTGLSAKGYAQSVLSSGQYGCLELLWNKESGWNPSATNASSGAYGIPQSLPGSKMASAGSDWRTNPVTQVKWGLGYINERYGSPCSAWGHSQSVGWY